jgi:hypothetical protein
MRIRHISATGNSTFTIKHPSTLPENSTVTIHSSCCPHNFQIRVLHSLSLLIYLRKLLPEDGELLVVRPEVVAPLGDTVGLVDYKSC